MSNYVNDHTMPRAYWLEIAQWVLLSAEQKVDVMRGACRFSVYDGTPILEYNKPVHWWSDRKPEGQV